MHSHFVQHDIRLYFLMKSNQPHCVYIFQPKFLTYTNTFTFSLQSLTLINTHIKWQRCSDSTLAKMPIITVHLLRLPTQSDVTWKASSKLTSCTLKSPSSFLCWLLLSVAVWDIWCLITIPLSNQPISHICAWGGVVPSRGHSKMLCAVQAYIGWMLNVVHFKLECHTPWEIILCSIYQITVITCYSKCSTYCIWQ